MKERLSSKAQNCLQQNMPQTYWELDSDNVTPTLSKVKLARWQIHWQGQIHGQCITDWCMCTGWYTFSSVHCRCQNFQWPSSWSCHICQKPVLVFMVKLMQKMQLLEVQVQVWRWGCWLAASRSQMAQTPGLLGSGISRDCFFSNTKDFCCYAAVAIVADSYIHV